MNGEDWLTIEEQLARLRQHPVVPTAEARAEAREQIARAMFDSDYSGTGFDWDDQAEGPDIGKAYYRRHADAVLAVPAVAEALAAVERVRAEVAEWDDATRRWYYDNRHTHPQGIGYVCGFEDGWNHAEECIRHALDGDQ